MVPRGAAPLTGWLGSFSIVSAVIITFLLWRRACHILGEQPYTLVYCFFSYYRILHDNILYYTILYSPSLACSLAPSLARSPSRSLANPLLALSLSPRSSLARPLARSRARSRRGARKPGGAEQFAGRPRRSAGGLAGSAPRSTVARAPCSVYCCDNRAPLRAP